MLLQKPHFMKYCDREWVSTTGRRRWPASLASAVRAMHMLRAPVALQAAQQLHQHSSHWHDAHIYMCLTEAWRQQASRCFLHKCWVPLYRNCSFSAAPSRA